MEVPNPPADSPPAPASAPAAPPPAPEPTPPLLPLKRRAREEPPAPPGPDAEILALAVRLQDLIGRRREQEASEKKGGPSPRGNRLRPKQTLAPANPDEEVLAVLAQARGAAPRRGGRRYATPNAEDHLEVLAGRWLRRALLPGAFVLVALLAFWLGRRNGSREPSPAGVAPAPVAPALTVPSVVVSPVPGVAAPAPAAASAAPRWSEKTLPALDDVFAARRAGDPGRAGALARSLRAENGALPGLELFLAENALHARRPTEATAALLPMLRADPPDADAIARLGFISARTRRLEEAASYFGQACAADPFRGDLFHRWAEALRRQGKSAEAVARFDQALLRPADDEGARPAPPEAAFRRRLARIEAGDVDPVRTETTAALNNPATGPETGRWLLTAAALELFDNRSGPAAATLAKARAALSDNEWLRLTGDLFFRNHATRRELAEFLPPAGSAADTRRVAALDRLPDVDFVDP